MKRHKKVLFDQIKEEDQGKRKKRSSTIYYFATEAFLNILKIVLIIVGSLALSVTVSVIVTAINNGQAPNTAVSIKSLLCFLTRHPSAAGCLFVLYRVALWLFVNKEPPEEALCLHYCDSVLVICSKRVFPS